MLNVSSFLEKFKEILGADQLLKDAVSKVLFDIFSIKIDPKNIDFKNGVISIKTNPAFKSEIFMKKVFILEEIRKSSGNKNIKDLR
jgi:hypothetical protein